MTWLLYRLLDAWQIWCDRWRYVSVGRAVSLREDHESDRDLQRRLGSGEGLR